MVNANERVHTLFHSPGSKGGCIYPRIVKFALRGGLMCNKKNGCEK